MCFVCFPARWLKQRSDKDVVGPLVRFRSFVDGLVVRARLTLHRNVAHSRLLLAESHRCWLPRWLWRHATQKVEDGPAASEGKSFQIAVLSADLVLSSISARRAPSALPSLQSSVPSHSSRRPPRPTNFGHAAFGHAATCCAAAGRALGRPGLHLRCAGVDDQPRVRDSWFLVPEGRSGHDKSGVFARGDG